MIRWSKNKGFYVENLFHVECNSVDDLMAVLEEGEVSHFCIPGIYVFFASVTSFYFMHSCPCMKDYSITF